VDQDFSPLVLEAVKRKTGTAASKNCRICISLFSCTLCIGAYKAFWLSHQRRAEEGRFAEKPAIGFGHSDYGADFEGQVRMVLQRRYGVLAEKEAESCELCLVNLWTPVLNPAYRFPLALLDNSTIDLATDTIRWKLHSAADNGYAYLKEAASNGTKKHGRPVDERVPQAAKDAPALGPLYSPLHRWVYLADMKPEEAVIFKQVPNSSSYVPLTRSVCIVVYCLV
jgi:hypothetical protein